MLSPQSPCPTRCCRRSVVPQTMLSPSLRTPHDVVAPGSAPDDVVPAVGAAADGAQTIVVAVATVPRRCCRRQRVCPTPMLSRPGRTPDDVVAVADRTPDDVVAVSGAPTMCCCSCRRACGAPDDVVARLARVFAAPHRTPVFQAFAVGTMNPLVRRWFAPRKSDGPRSARSNRVAGTMRGRVDLARRTAPSAFRKPAPSSSGS